VSRHSDRVWATTIERSEIAVRALCRASGAEDRCLQRAAIETSLLVGQARVSRLGSVTTLALWGYNRRA
jgi:hypothetical protein